MKQPNIDLSHLTGPRPTELLLAWQEMGREPNRRENYSNVSDLPEELVMALFTLQQAIQAQMQSPHSLPDLVRLTSAAVKSSSATFARTSTWTIKNLVDHENGEVGRDLYQEAVVACSIALGRLALSTEVNIAFDCLSKRRDEKNLVSDRGRVLLLAVTRARVSNPETWALEFLTSIARSSFLTAVDHAAERRNFKSGMQNSYVSQ